MTSLLGKVAIVTGAAQGIGAEYAKALAGAGASVVVSDIADGSGVAGQINEAGGRAIALQADITDGASLARLVEATEAAFGPIEILVNNAGLFGTIDAKPFEQITEAEWDRMMVVNTRGPFQTAKAVVPSMRRNGRGKIINIASGTFFKGPVGYPHYVASKGAVLAFTRSLARELGKDNILVNCISPGFTESESVMRNPAFGQARQFVPGSRILQRSMTPHDLVGTMLFLAGPDSDFLTGQNVVVDGGGILL